MVIKMVQNIIIKDVNSLIAFNIIDINDSKDMWDILKTSAWSLVKELYIQSYKKYLTTLIAIS